MSLEWGPLWDSAGAFPRILSPTASKQQDEAHCDVDSPLSGSKENIVRALGAVGD